MSFAVDVMVTDLREVLTINKETHVKDYEEARTEWLKTISDDLEFALNKVKNGKVTPKNAKVLRKAFERPIPQLHEKDYEEALELIALHEGSTIELSEGEFQKYYKDNWDWKYRFMTTSNSYIAGKFAVDD